MPPSKERTEMNNFYLYLDYYGQLVLDEPKFAEKFPKVAEVVTAIKQLMETEFTGLNISQISQTIAGANKVIEANTKLFGWGAISEAEFRNSVSPHEEIIEQASQKVYPLFLRLVEIGLVKKFEP